MEAERDRHRPDVWSKTVLALLGFFDHVNRY
jgi:hypothetical protein